MDILEIKMEQLKAVVYCRKNTQKELDLRKVELSLYAQKNSYHIVRTITEFAYFANILII